MNGNAHVCGLKVKVKVVFMFYVGKINALLLLLLLLLLLYSAVSSPLDRSKRFTHFLP